MIAISYRREDSLSITGRLYDRLETKFGRQKVFMDFDSMRPGLDFRQQIRETIEKSDVVLAIIGPNWFGERGGKRRIDDPADFVRLEIEYALNRRIPVIPVLIDETPMPTPDQLPEAIAGLVFRHALPLDSGLDFRQHADRLIAGVADLIGFHLTQQSFGPPASQLREDQSRSWVKRWGKQAAVWLIVLLAVGAAVAVWQLRSKPTIETKLPIANSIARTGKEIAKCEKYRATWTPPSEDDAAASGAEGTIWILVRPSDALLATIQSGVGIVEKGVFSSDGKYLAFDVGGGSTGTIVRLFRIREESGAIEIKLTTEEQSPEELIKAVSAVLIEKLHLPPGGSFDHTYFTPLSVGSSPVFLFFDFYADRYSSDHNPSIKIGKATRFRYRNETKTFDVAGPLPEASRN